MGAVYRARTGKSSAAYEPHAVSSPQYQQVQQLLHNRSSYSNNASGASTFSFGTAPQQPQQASVFGANTNTGGYSLPAQTPLKPLGASPPPPLPGFGTATVSAIAPFKPSVPNDLPQIKKSDK